MKTIIKKINLNALSSYLLAILVVAIPSQGFLLTWARHIFNLSSFSYSVISFWKEYILIALIFIIGLKFFKEKKVGFKLLRVDKIVLIFFGLVLLYLVFFNLPLSQKLAGIRYDTEFLLFYFVIRLLNFDIKKLKILIYAFLAVSIPTIIFGLLQISILPPEFMEQFGYVRNLSDYAKTGILATYEYVNPSLPGVYRIQSTFPGALQFGSYLVLIAALWVSFVAYFKNRVKYIYISGFLLSIWALYGTHTRSAWIAAAVAIVIIISFFIKNKKILISLIVLIAVLGASAVLIFFNNPKFQTILLHGEIRNDGQLYGSTQAHLEALNNNIEVFKNKPLGNGVGFAGPASKYGTNQVITENWYLQIGLELGIAGLAVFVGVIICFITTLNKIYKITQDNFQKYLSLGLLATLVGIAISSLMLHTFADTATVYPLFIFIGILISLNQRELT